MSGHMTATLTPVDAGSPGLDLHTPTGFYVTDLRGWDDLAPARFEGGPFSLAHGSSSGLPGLRDSISGTLGIEFEGSPATVAEKNAELLALCAQPLLLTVTDHDGVARSRRIVVEQVRVSDRHDPDELLTASITWTAVDPRRYSAMVPVTSGKAHNHGTAPTSPVLVVTGPVSSGVTVTEVETGRATRWVGSLQAGQDLRLDPASGFATVDGKVVMGLRRAEWPLIPPGEARSYQATAGKLTVEHRSGWW